jgi:hypothetical protein
MDEMGADHHIIDLMILGATIRVFREAAGL